MGNLIVATPELGDAATLSTTGTVAAGLPLTNLQDRRLSKVCRFTSLTGMVIFIDTGAVGDIDLVALLGTNASAAATWRVRTADTQAGTSSAPAYDSGSLSMSPQAVLTGIGASNRWARIDIADAANADGYFDIGRLYLAGGDTYWQPDLNVAEGWQLGVEDDSEVAVNLSGGLLTTPRNVRRVLRATFDFQSEAELYGNAYRLLTERGLGRDLLAIRDPAGSYLAEQTVYGVLESSQPIVHRAVALYAWNLTVRELV